MLPLPRRGKIRMLLSRLGTAISLSSTVTPSLSSSLVAGPWMTRFGLTLPSSVRLEDEDRIAQRLRDEDLVPSRVGRVRPHLEIMDAAAHLGVVALDMPLRIDGAIAAALIAREARMAHAVRRDDLVAGKRQRPGIAEPDNRHVRRNLDRELRTRARVVPISCIELDRPMLPVRDHELVMGIVDKHA